MTGKKIDEAKAKSDAEQAEKAAKARPRRKGSGEVGAEEDKARREAQAVKLEKQAKAVREGVPLDRDELEVAGSVTGDAYEEDSSKPFAFDQSAKAKTVKHVALASNANEVWLELDGAYFAFDAQFAAGIHRLFDRAMTNLNL